MFDSKQIYQNFIKYRNSDEWLTLPDEEKAMIEARVKEAHQNVLSQELKKPVITPFDKPAVTEYEEVTPLTTAKNVVKSFARIPSAIVSTGATGLGFGADLVGADNAAKTLYDTASQVDKQAQEYFPNTFKPIEDLDEFKNAFNSWSNLGQLGGKIVSMAPEVVGSSLAMAAPGAGAAKIGSLLGKSDKVINALRLAGLGAGSTFTSGGGIQRDQYNKTSELPDATQALPYAAAVGALDFLPGSMEQGLSKGLTKWLTGQAGEELAKRGVIGTGLDLLKSGASEFVQEGAQGGIEGSYQYKDQGFLPSIQSGFSDPKVQAQMLQEGLAAALSNAGGSIMGRSGNSAAPAPVLPDLKSIKTEAEALDFISKVAGMTPEQRAIEEKRIKDHFSAPAKQPDLQGQETQTESEPPSPFLRAGGAILPTEQDLDNTLISGMVAAEKNQRSKVRQYLDLINQLKAENTPSSLNEAKALEDEFFERFNKYDPYWVEKEMNETLAATPRIQQPAQQPAQPSAPQPAAPKSQPVQISENLSPEERINRAYRAATVLEAAMSGDRQASSDWNEIPWETQVAAKHILDAEKAGRPVDMKLIGDNIASIQNDEQPPIQPEEKLAAPEIKNTDARVQFGLGVLKKIAADPQTPKFKNCSRSLLSWLRKYRIVPESFIKNSFRPAKVL